MKKPFKIPSSPQARIVGLILAIGMAIGLGFIAGMMFYALKYCS